VSEALHIAKLFAEVIDHLNPLTENPSISLYSPLADFEWRYLQHKTLVDFSKILVISAGQEEWMGEGPLSLGADHDGGVVVVHKLRCMKEIVNVLEEALALTVDPEGGTGRGEGEDDYNEVDIIRLKITLAEAWRRVGNPEGARDVLEQEITELYLLNENSEINEIFENLDMNKEGGGENNGSDFSDDNGSLKNKTEDFICKKKLLGDALIQLALSFCIQKGQNLSIRPLVKPVPDPTPDSRNSTPVLTGPETLPESSKTIPSQQLISNLLKINMDEPPSAISPRMPFQKPSAPSLLPNRYTVTCIYMYICMYICM
jgi:hypothetical protein